MFWFYKILTYTNKRQNNGSLLCGNDLGKHLVKVKRNCIVWSIYLLWIPARSLSQYLLLIFSNWHRLVTMNRSKNTEVRTNFDLVQFIFAMLSNFPLFSKNYSSETLTLLSIPKTKLVCTIESIENRSFASLWYKMSLFKQAWGP